MKLNGDSVRRLFLLLVGMLMVGGCAATPQPSSLLQPSKTAVLPVADLRPDRGEGQDVKHLLHNAYFARLLNQKGYHVSFVADGERLQGLQARDLTAADATWMRPLGPADARWLLLVVLEEVRRTQTLESAFAAQCMGLLFDNAQGAVVWRNALFHREIAGGDFPPEQWHSAVAQGCFQRLLRTLPPRN
jgi:hypothetical protein